MPGARLASFRLGDRSEVLIENLLTGFAFTTRVPRQEDVGIDFLCSLITGNYKDDLLRAGAFFAVQARSSAEKLIYEKPYELEWIGNQENPLLLCIADRKKMAMDVYSTWNLLCGVLGGWRGEAPPTRITLCPGETGKEWPGIRNNPDGSQDILLGKPIIRITYADLTNKQRTQEIAEVIGGWVELDRTNIVNRYAGMFWVVGPREFETGEPPKQKGLSFYWNPDNLDQSTKNLCRSATALWFLLRRHAQISRKIDLNDTTWREGVAALRVMLRWCQRVMPGLKEFIGDINSEL